MDPPENRHPPSGQRERVEKDLGFTNSPTYTQALHKKQETTVGETIVGCVYIVIRIESYFFYPDVTDFGWRRYKTGLRIGLPYRVRIRGKRGDSHITTHRYTIPTLAARKHHALKQRLDIPRCGVRLSYDDSLALMGAAVLTYQGAISAAGQAFVQSLRRLGVPVADDPITERASRRYWFADYATDNG